MQSRNEGERENHSSGWNVEDTIVTICVVAVLVTVAFYIWTTKPEPHNFSPFQPLEQMESEYKECKMAAPEGFDCYMQPVLVSEAFIIAESAK